jgi:hypothetical protein
MTRHLKFSLRVTPVVFKNSDPTSQKTNYVPIKKTTQLMLFMEIISLL